MQNEVPPTEVDRIRPSMRSGGAVADDPISPRSPVGPAPRSGTRPPITHNTRALGRRIGALGGLVVVYALLGPLILDVIHFRTSASGLNQVRGGDLAALAVVAPVCFVVAGLARRGHPAAPVLALAPGMFAMYTYSQLILGNEYLYRPGNVERFFPLLLAMFILAATVVLPCWSQVRSETLPASTSRLRRGSGILLLVIAAFVGLVLHLPGLIDAYRDSPRARAYLELPTTFWVVKFYDLGIVVPAAAAVGIGLLRKQAWARKPAYAIIGGYVLLGWSVAGMAWTMVLKRDPDASVALAVGCTVLSAAGSLFAFFLYRPLFGSPAAAETAILDVPLTPAEASDLDSPSGADRPVGPPAGTNVPGRQPSNRTGSSR